MFLRAQINSAVEGLKKHHDMKAQRVVMLLGDRINLFFKVLSGLSL